MVEHNLAKVGVAGSSPVVRSIACIGPVFESALFISTAKWPSGKAEACKAFTPGSNPGFASRSPRGPSERRAPFRSRAPRFGRCRRRGAGARTPDGGDSVGVPLRPLRLRNPPAPAAGVPLRLPDPGAFPNGARNPIWRGPKTVQMGFSAPFGIRTFAEGGHVLGRFLDTLLSIKPLFVDYASIVRFSTYVAYLSIVEEKLERYSFAMNLMDTCRFSGGSAAEKKVHHGLFQEELLQADGCRGDNGRICTFSHAFHRRNGADQ